MGTFGAHQSSPRYESVSIVCRLGVHMRTAPFSHTSTSQHLLRYSLPLLRLRNPPGVLRCIIWQRGLYSTSIIFSRPGELNLGYYPSLVALVAALWPLSCSWRLWSCSSAWCSSSIRERRVSRYLTFQALKQSHIFSVSRFTDEHSGTLSLFKTKLGICRKFAWDIPKSGRCPRLQIPALVWRCSSR